MGFESEREKLAFAKHRQCCRGASHFEAEDYVVGCKVFLAEQQQGQGVLSMAADRLREERGGTLHGHKYQRRGLIPLEEVYILSLVAPVADGPCDVTIAFKSS